METQIIIQNAQYCNKCDRFLVSEHVHDFVSCGHRFVDGGKEYCRGTHCNDDEKDDYILFNTDARLRIIKRLLYKDGDKYKLLDLATQDELKCIIEQGHCSRLQLEVAKIVLSRFADSTNE